MKKKGYFTRAILFGPIIACLLWASPTFAANRFGDVYHSVQIVDELGEKVTDISSVLIYLPNTTTNAVIYSDRNRQNTITLPMTTGSTNTTLVDGLIEWWGGDGYDFSVTDGSNIHTNANHRTRTSSEGRLVFPSYLQSISSTTYTDAQSATWGTGSDWVSNGGAVADRMTWIPATADTAEFWIGSTNFPANLELYGATSGFDLRWDASQNRLEFDDDATLAIGTGADYTIVHSAGTTTISGAYSTTGIRTFVTDVIFDSTNNIKFDDSRSQLHFQDNALAGFGGAADAVGDVTMTHDGSDFILDAAIADEGWLIGDTTTGFDIAYRFETAGEFRTDYDADFINLTDDMDLRFGTGGSADGDFQISSSAANLLTIGQIVAGTGSVAIGVDDAGLDWTFFGDTTAVTMKWTTATNLLAFTGQVNVMTFEGTTVDGVDTIIAVADPTSGNQTWTFPDLGVADSLAIMGSTLVTNAPEIANSVTGGTNQLIFEGSDADTEETVLTVVDPTADNTYTFADDTGNVAYTPVGGTTYGAGAGAIPITHTYVAYTSSGGAEALTLADGKPGQIITIAVVVDGGNGVLTPTTKAGWTSVDLADDGDTISLLFVDTSGWVVLGTAGVAAPPALTVP